MTGFAAIIDLVPEGEHQSDAELDQMLALMRPRGPDGEIRASTKSSRLAVLTHEPNIRPNQLIFQQQDLMLAGDLRLDQRATLLQQLGLDTNVGDAEFLLAAYRRFGDQVVNHVLGDFSFVVTDGHRVFCARDHLGVKPLYYHFSGRRLVLASEAAAVQRVVQVELNHQRIGDYLVYPLEHADQTSSFYKEIYRLPPASWLTLSNGNLCIDAYWTPDPAHQIRFKSDDEYSDAFRALFQAAVADRIDPDGAGAGSMLSGGVDSSTIVGFAQAVKPVTTFSTVEFADNCADTSFITRTQRHLGQSAVMITTDDARLVMDKIFNAVKQVSEPFDHYMIQNMLVNQAAAAQGFCYLLDGLEGDMLHSLPSNYPSGLMREGDICAGLAEVYYVWKHAYGRDGSLPQAYYQGIRHIGLPDSLDWVRQVRRRFIRQVSPLEGSLISRSFAAEHNVVMRLRMTSERLYGGRQTLQQQHLRNVTHPAIAAATERYDRVAGMFGIEPRHPLMDKRLVEFSLGIPRKQKTFHGWSKFHLRRIGQGVIPAEVSWRVGRDENAWRFIDLFNATYRDEMRAQILDEPDILMPYIEPKFLQASGDDDLLELFGLFSWLKRNP